MEMCRFTSKDDPGYKQVGGELRILSDRLRQEKEELDKVPGVEDSEAPNTCCVFQLDLLANNSS